LGFTAETLDRCCASNSGKGRPFGAFDFPSQQSRHLAWIMLLQQGVHVVAGKLMDHYLSSTPEHLHWGLWKARRSPAISISPGDRVTIETLPAEPDGPGDGSPGIRQFAGQEDLGHSGRLPRLLTGPFTSRGLNQAMCLRYASSISGSERIGAGTWKGHRPRGREATLSIFVAVTLPSTERAMSRACHGAAS